MRDIRGAYGAQGKVQSAECKGGERPLRVLIVADAVGGVWDACLALASALIASGQACVLLAVAGPPPSEHQRAAAAAVPGLDLRTLEGRLEWQEGGRDWLARHRDAVASLALEWEADLLHVNQLGLAGVGAALADRSGGRRRPPVLLGVHSDLVSWWTWVKDGGAAPRTFPDYLRWQVELAQAALREADAVVCPSAFLATEVARHYGLSEVPHVVHNAVTLPLAHDAPASVPREHDLAIVAGRVWDEAKNVRLVAEALRLCRKHWQVEVAGDMAEPGRGPAAMPSAPGMRYLGHLAKPELAKLMQRAAVYVAPALYDPFGLGPAEAALAGCTVVANDIPSYREVWGPAGLFFQRNDAASLAALLERLHGDPDTTARHAALARARVLQRYTPQRMAAGYLGLYRGLTSGRSGYAGGPTESVGALGAPSLH